MIKSLFLVLFLSVSLLCPAHEGNFIANDMLQTMKPGDKAALLMVHFGTTHDDTRALTIDAINAKARQTFPQLEVREAYTSRIIVRRLKARGIEKQAPIDALLRLRSEGYTHIVVQSSNIIEGVEMESLRRDVESVRIFFKEIRLSTPLLYTTEDAETVVDILTKRLTSGTPVSQAYKGGSITEETKGKHTSGKPSKESFILVGHGTCTPSTAIYSQIDYMLKDSGWNNFHVSTIEGYPTFNTMLKQLKADKNKQVTLVPFMFVAGDHADNDISVDWKQALEKEGFTVSVRMEGLGQIPEIQQMFIDRISFVLKHRQVDIMEKKAAYATGKEPE